MTFPQRAIGAARLEISAFEDVEADRRATGQALAVVVLSSAAGGFGLSSDVYDAPVVTRIVLSLLLWVFSAALTYGIGRHLMPEALTRTNVGELLRTIGFAATPGLLRVSGSLPVIGPSLYALSTGWMLLATVIAVRQALDYTSTARAVVVCLIAWVIGVGLAAICGALLFLLVEQVVS